MEELIHRDNPQKLYIQLSEIMKRKIENKEWNVDFQIPTEDELCKTYEVSRATVRSAISELVKHGYLSRQQGKGTFVCKIIKPDELTMLASFREFMLEGVTDFSTIVLAKTTTTPLDDLSTKLNIPAYEHIIYIKRLRTADNKPVLLQETYIPAYICPQLLEEDIENNSLYELFEKKYGIPITHVKNYFDIAYLNAEEGRILGLPENSSVLLLNQNLYSWETQIMYARTINRSDRFKFGIDFQKTL